MKEFGLEPGEHVVKEARKHWFLFVAELLPYAIFVVIPLALPALLMLIPPLAPYAALLNYRARLPQAILGIWLLVVWTGAWGVFTRYYLNLWVLTDRRIVDIKQSGYFHREVSSLLISRVQDVTTDVEGVVSSLLSIGDITVQSAGAVDEFVMRSIPRPEEMRDIILKYVAEKAGNQGV